MLKKIYRRVRNVIETAIIYIFEVIIIPIVILLCWLFRFIPKKIDIGMGPLPMINYVYWAKALRKRGYTVETFVVNTYFITEEFDFICDKKQHRYYRKYPLLLFFRCVLRYSAMYIYFNGGPLQNSVIYRNLEPCLFKIANTKLVVMPYGSDVQVFERTPNKVTACNLCKDYPYFFQKTHSRIIKQIDMWTKNADIVVGAMDSIDYMYFWNRTIPCHFAIDTDKICPNEITNEKVDNTIKILHAPNHMSIKGTEFIEMAIEKLKNEGYDIDYCRIQKVSNEEVIKKIKEADIVIDQLVMGWYAMFAMEAMACAKPCVCYLRDDLVDTFVKIGCLKKDEIPLISAGTDTIYDVLKDLIEHKENFENIGRKSREYVVNHHSLDVIGEFFEEINSSIGVEKQNNKGGI